MRKLLPALLINLLLLSALSVFYLTLPQVYRDFDDRLRDLLFVARGSKPHADQILIVTIDERSLQALGQWPWERVKLARILHNLDQAGALIIGLDILFAEQDRTSPRLIAELYGMERESLPDYDAIFAATIARTPVVTGYLFDFKESAEAAAAPVLPAEIRALGRGDREFLPQAGGVVVNLPVLQQQALSAGFLNNIPDQDGVIRSVPLLISYRDAYYTSLAFELFRLLQGSPPVAIRYQPTGISHLELGDLSVPTDFRGRLHLDYLGPQGSFPSLSAADVFAGQFDPEQVRDKVVLVGATAVGLLDLRATPFDNAQPGIEVHATVLDNLLQRRFIHRADWVMGADLLLMLGLGLLLTLVYSYLSATAMLAALLASCWLVYHGIAMLLFEHGLIINILFPFATVLLVTVSTTLSNYYFETKQKNLIRDRFARKVSAAVAEDILRKGDRDILIGRSREISIFFSDVRGFTQLAEDLGDPEKVIDLLNIYMTPMVAEIMRTSGTVDKFIGDAIMAYWNAPTEVADHADRAVSAALAQLRQLHQVNQALQAKYGVRIDIGMGINSGVATVGEMGSEGRSDYTVIGDSVNLASRLEGLNKLYGSHLIISDSTRARLRGDYLLRELDLVRVKGKQEPVRIHEVLGFAADGTLPGAPLTDYLEALSLYRQADFTAAGEAFAELVGHDPQPLYRLYLERCRHYRQDPPENFDGVFVPTSK